MAVSLAFHIVFAAIGVGLPALLLLSHGLWLRTGEPVWLRLTKAWSKGLAVFFAVGAVSGTVLSFELGLLFPRFMEVAGPLVGMPFSLEGFAFFTEAITPDSAPVIDPVAAMLNPFWLANRARASAQVTRRRPAPFARPTAASSPAR